VSDLTHPNDEPGNFEANTSGYRSTSARFRLVARTTQHPATAKGLPPPIPIASSSTFLHFQADDRTAAPTSSMVFQHSISASVFRAQPEARTSRSSGTAW
jgi:hypothetical protein